jgi:hypothetical protein
LAKHSTSSKDQGSSEWSSSSHLSQLARIFSR